VSPVAPRAAQPARPADPRAGSAGPSSQKNYLGVADLSATEIMDLLEHAIELKRDLALGHTHHILPGKTAALVFQKPSLRTRVSFEVAMLQLGGHSLYLSPAEIQLGQRESIPDASRVLSRYIDAIIARVFLHSDVTQLAEHSFVPVINALSDREHPCQILADLMTLLEKRGTLRGLKLAYVGDGNNVANSLAVAAARLGLELRLACPDGYEPDPGVLEEAATHGDASAVELFRDPREAVRGAEAVYTDSWYSMGQEGEADLRAPAFRPYQLNAELLSVAEPGALAMHCLPAHRNQEITDEVLDGPASIVYDQAENRLHVQKALLVRLLARG
jgi:ornithine carbamoyltransferase